MVSKIVAWQKIMGDRKQITDALHSRLKLGKFQKNGAKFDEVKIFYS